MPQKLKKLISLILCIFFLLEQSGLAQVLPALTPMFSPPAPYLRYLSVNSANPANYFNPDFAIGMRHRDAKEGCRFGSKKCAHTFSM